MSGSNVESLASSQRIVPPLRFALLLCWSAVVVLLGGLSSGLAISRFGTLGAVSLWLVGEVAGKMGRRIVFHKSKAAGGILVVSCVAAFLVAETCWLHWNTVQGEASWLAAIRLLPVFFREKTLAAAIGGAFCLIGANSAYRQVARRYRIVRVVEDSETA